MGCTSSQVPDPNAHYRKNGTVRPTQGHTHNGNVKHTSKVTPQQNGHVANGDVSIVTTITNVSGTITANGEAFSDEHADKLNDTTLTSETTSLSLGRPHELSRTLKGDLSQRQEARLSRELKLKDMHKIREQKAMRISELVMEEKERLSISTLSRSRATSRTGSPRGLHRGDSMRPCTSTMIEASFSSPVPKSCSEESLPQVESVRPSAMKSTNGRRRKGEPKVRIVTDDMDQSESTTQGPDTSDSHPKGQRKSVPLNSNVDIANNNNKQNDVRINSSKHKNNLL